MIVASREPAPAIGTRLTGRIMDGTGVVHVNVPHVVMRLASFDEWFAEWKDTARPQDIAAARRPGICFYEISVD